MPIDRARLKAELLTDPAGVGYGGAVRDQDDAAAAALLNARTGAGAATIELNYVSRDDFLKAITPALLRIPTLATPAGSPETIQAKWDRILGVITTGQGVMINDNIKYMLSVAVADGVLTQAEADAAWHRVGSRAEVLFGPDTAVSAADVSVALRGDA